MSDWAFLNANGRVTEGRYATKPEHGCNGLFEFMLAGEARRIRVIASDEGGWKHVSVSFGKGATAVPSWDLMCRIKDLFFEPDDVVMQLHPKKADYVNRHVGCLHLWMPLDQKIPTPPKWMV